VTVVSVGGGLAYAGLGPTHHACEDLAFLRAIPNMVVIAPADSWEVRAALRAVLKQDRPAYIRLGKKGEPVVHKGVIADFEIGRAITLSDGSDICLLSTGNMLPEAVEAAHLLKARALSARVVSFHTVKPLDEACLAEAFANFPLVVTLEEHSVNGGFGSAVAEWMADHGPHRASLLRIGTPDAFFKKSGEQEYARHLLGLDAAAIAARAADALAPV
jgi:transketolase